MQSASDSHLKPVVKVPKVAEVTEVKKPFKRVVELVTGPKNEQFEREF